MELLEDNIFPISIEYNRFGLVDEFPDTLKNIVFEYVNEDPEDVDEYGSVDLPRTANSTKIGGLYFDV